MTRKTGEKFQQLIDIMEKLRSECPWDREQTADSLKKYILEEAYEVVEAIDHQNWKHLSAELGDLLLQVVFQSEIASEKGYFFIGDVIESICNKLIQRHPHVFGETEVQSAHDVEGNWEYIKVQKEGRRSLLDGIPKTAPALLTAQRLQEKAAKVDFDWKNISEVLKKLEEEITEFKKALSAQNKNLIEEETGDILFTIVNLARFLDITAEEALRKSNHKFVRRFQYIEREFGNNYQKMKDAGLETLDKKWEEAKKKIR
jgi:MazG family protein